MKPEARGLDGLTPGPDRAARIILSGTATESDIADGLAVASAVKDEYARHAVFRAEYSDIKELPIFDGVWAFGPWESLDLDAHRRFVRAQCQDGAIWLSGYEQEARWLGDLADGPASLPPREALYSIDVYREQLVGELGFRVIPEIALDRPAAEWHSVARSFAWQIGLGAKHSHKTLASNKNGALAVLESLRDRHESTDLVLQAHVAGRRETLTFVAWQSELLRACLVQWPEAREGAKCSGMVTPLSRITWRRLASVIRKIKWHGIGELDLISADGHIYLEQWRASWSRAAYVAGLGGEDVIGALLSKASGRAVAPTSFVTSGFILVTKAVTTGALARSEASTDNRHSEREQARSPFVQSSARASSLELVSDVSMVLRDLEEVDVAALRTPAWIFLPKLTRDAWHDAGRLVAAAARTSTLQIDIAYSVKTNPSREALRAARDAGFILEAITQDELAWVRENGFSPREVVLNGPGKWWPPAAAVHEPLAAVFADSVEELGRVTDVHMAGGLQAEIVGVRVRAVPSSRFGVTLEAPAILKRVSTILQGLPDNLAIGVHFHIASQTTTWPHWWDAASRVIRLSRKLEDASGRAVSCVDVGGGWFPEDFYGTFLPTLPELAQLITTSLPSVRRVILEPGRGLAQITTALALSVLEVRSRGDGASVIVDGSIAYLPRALSYPHRLIWYSQTDRDWFPVEPGRAEILGLLCREDDVLAHHVTIPDRLQPGDLLIVGDAGSYDISTAYSFGRGGWHLAYHHG